MPLQPFKLAPDISRKVNQKINALLKRGVLHRPPEDHIQYRAGFCMPIQIISHQEIETLKFSKPEGFRVFIQHLSTVLAAVDFMQKNDRLTLSAIHQGPGLREILTALNKLELKFDKLAAPCRPELIYFMLAKGPFIKVTSGKQVSFFKFHKDRLSPTTPEQLRRQIQTIRKQHQTSSI